MPPVRRRLVAHQRERRADEELDNCRANKQVTNFLRWYDYTAAAILEALPTATVSRTIIAGIWVAFFQERQQ